MDLPANPGHPINADSRFQKSRFPSNALEENKPRDESHPLFASQKFDQAPKVAYGSVPIIHRTTLLFQFLHNQGHRAGRTSQGEAMALCDG